MKKLISSIILSTALIVAMTSCEEDSDTDLDIAAELAGVWIFNETQGDFAPQTYTVTITRLGANDIEMKNFYNLGNSNKVSATLTGSGISIPTQSVNGNAVSGSATYNDDFDSMNLNFSVNDGASVDNVVANAQKQ